MVKSHNSSLLFGGLLGSTAIALNAYTTHVLQAQLTPHDFESMQTAVYYQLFHAVLFVTLGMSGERPHDKNTPVLRFATRLLVLGLILFCGSIYLTILSPFHLPFPLAPFGGITLIAGWFMLALAGFYKK